MAAVLSIMVLVAIALLVGALAAWRGGARKQAALMLVLAAVMAINVGIWTIPGRSGEAPLARIPD